MEKIAGISSANGGIYEDICAKVSALCEDESDLLANLSNIAALVYAELNEKGVMINWLGWYIVRGDCLVLGPFQGQLACTRLKGKGICWRAYRSGKPVLIEDVAAEKDHIYCDSLTKSEVVVPVVSSDGSVVAVLDADSPLLSGFSSDDLHGFQTIVATFQLHNSQLWHQIQYGENLSAAAAPRAAAVPRVNGKSSGQDRKPRPAPSSSGGSVTDEEVLAEALARLMLGLPKVVPLMDLSNAYSQLKRQTLRSRIEEVTRAKLSVGDFLVRHPEKFSTFRKGSQMYASLAGGDGGGDNARPVSAVAQAVRGRGGGRARGYRGGSSNSQPRRILGLRR